jgi:hypothetical protein
VQLRKHGRPAEAFAEVCGVCAWCLVCISMYLFCLTLFACLFICLFIYCIFTYLFIIY